MEKVLFYIDGNIGLGKSTLMSKLEENKNYNVIDEPLSKYCSFYEKYNPLSMFYEKKITNFEFFSYLYHGVWFPMINDLVYGKTPVICRGVHSGAYIFGTDESSSFISSLKDHIAKEYISILKKKYERIVVLYLQLDPDECYRRLKERNREEESGVTLEYINDLHNLHEKIFSGKHEEIGFDVIKINVSNLTREEVHSCVKDAIENVINTS